MTLREEFERLFAPPDLLSDEIEQLLRRDSDGEYTHRDTWFSWRYYQAATAAAIERCIKACKKVQKDDEFVDYRPDYVEALRALLNTELKEPKP